MKLPVLLAATPALLAGSAEGVFYVLGQIDPAPGWLSVVIQLGSFGLVAYLIIMGLPSLQREIKVERQTERADYAATLNRITDDRRVERVDFSNAIKVVTDFAHAEIAEIRTSTKVEVDNLRSIFREEQRETRAYYAAEAEAMRKMYFDAVQAMRTAVHDVKDVASTVVNRSNLAIEVAKHSQQAATAASKS